MDNEQLQQELDAIIQNSSPEELLDELMKVIDSTYDANLIDAPSETDALYGADYEIEDNTVTNDPATPPAPRWNVRVNEVELDRDKERLVRMSQVFGKFASTLLSRSIKVGIHSDNGGPDAPAWSDSESITFNKHKIGKLDKPSVVTSLRGLALHEIAHILMTPRDGTQLTKMVRQADAWQAFNALEDMRIETFMTSRYSNVSDWLTATIAQFLLNEPDQIQYQFPLVYGRKYLPSDIRIMVRDAYQQPQDVAELEQLIDNYIVLNLADPANYKDAFAIILRYKELVSNITNHNQQTGFDVVSSPNGHHHRKVGEWKPNNGKALNKQQQATIIKRIRVSNGSDYDSTPHTPQPQPDPSNSPVSDPSNTGTPSDTSSSTAGSTSPVEKNLDTLKGLLKDIYDRRQEDIVNTIRQFNGDADLKGKAVAEPKAPWHRSERDVSPETVVASRSFGTELEQLRGDYDPGWLRKVEAGRLNVQRYVTGGDVDEAFDEWQIGRDDAVDIEAVVLLDISGSMDWCIENAYQSMWAIKRALDKVNASTTVLAFDTDYYSLYKPTERAGIKMRYSGSGGGTDAKGAVEYANNVFAESNRAIKVFIAITDGYWYDSADTDATIARLRNSGVVTALAYVNDPRHLTDGSTISIDSHGCETAVNITDTRDLFTLARKLVKIGVGRNLVA